MTTKLRILAFPKDGGNSYLRLFSGSLEQCGGDVEEFNFIRAFFRRFDVFIIHWPDTHLRTHSWWRAVGKHIRLFMLLVLMRLRGTKVVWILHNLKPHERDHWISRTLFPVWFPRLCSHVVALTATGLVAACERFPSLRLKQAAVIPHGHYRDAYGPKTPKAEARRQLGLDPNCPTILFFGSIRHYKNVPALIKAFRSLPGDDLQLVVAGLPVLGVQAADLEELAAGDSRIKFHLRFIEDSEVSAFFGACDLVTLPFTDVLNSGSVLLSLSFDRPVLAPEIGALPELRDTVGERWLRLYEGDLTAAHLAESLTGALTIRESERVDLSAFEWNAIARATIDFVDRGRMKTGESTKQDSPDVTVEEGASIAPVHR